MSYGISPTYEAILLTLNHQHLTTNNIMKRVFSPESVKEGVEESLEASRSGQGA
jgi:hypothetical protein